MILEDFIVKHGEVQGESELNKVAGGKTDCVCGLVSLLALLLKILEDVVLGVLGQVAVKVTDHLDEENLVRIGTFSVKDMVFYHFNDLVAVSLKLGHDLSLVGLKGRVKLGVLRILLNGRDCFDCGALATDKVF